MNSREKILQRLRQSSPLQNPATSPFGNDAGIFADYTDDENKWLSQFRAKFAALNGELYEVGNIAEAGQQIQKLLSGASPVLAQEHPLIREILPTVEPDTDFYPGLELSAPEFAEYQAAISVADCLVARTGSIVLNSRSAGGRRLSILPPLHIVIAKTNQLVPSLSEAIALYLKTKMDWSYAVIITGPSRTSDIEKQLVLGAHGPKRLAIVLLHAS